MSEGETGQPTGRVRGRERGEILRVLVADDHPVCRLGVAQVLSAAHDIEVVGEAGNGVEAVEAVERLEPDLVLMDLSMPVLDGFGALEQIRERFPDVGVIVLTSSYRPEHVFRALEAGACGYLVKTSEPGELLAAVRAGCQGSMPISAAMTRQVLEASRPSTLPLSSREIEVLRLVADGNLNKQVARRLGITEKTVKAHLTRIFQRIGVHDRTGAATWAARNLPAEGS